MDITITFLFNDCGITIPQKDESFVQHAIDISNKERKDRKQPANGPIILNSVYHGTLYSNILDNAPTTFTMDMLLHALKIGMDYFKPMQISAKTKTRIQCWVKSLGKYSYTWTELMDKPNYSLEVFSKRYWPFYNVESKDWQNITLEAKAADYASEIIGDTNKESNVGKDYKLETTVSQKYNNYLGYSVMDPANYPDMSKILIRLRTIMDIGLTTLMFEAVLRFLITPSTCHIIKEPALWDLINPLMNLPDHKKIFFHYMYYSMFILHHEDTIMFSQVRRNYRIIFNHTEALCMPTTYHMHMELDPYIQQLTGETYMAESIPFYLRCKRYLVSKKNFKRRFFLATGGALAGIPLHKYRASVSGSILIPCLTYTELEDDFVGIRFDTSREAKMSHTNLYDFCDNLTEKEKDFVSYLEYYYPSYHSLTDKDHVNKVLTQHAAIKIVEIKDETDEKSDEAPAKKKYNQISDIDISISAETYDIFKDLSLMLGAQIQENCKHIGDVWIRKVQTMSSFKYEIYGPGLMRPIDLFRIPYGPDKMTKKFHVPIVRTWYDGRGERHGETIKVISDDSKIDQFWVTKLKDNIDDGYNRTDEKFECVNNIADMYEKGIHTYRSCLCAALSGVNDSYKWFSCNKVPVDVVLKYAQRGVATVLNKKEIVALIAFMKLSDRWTPFINSPDFDVCGSMSLKHIFFHPDALDAGIRFGLRKFSKYITNFYSRRQPVGIAKTETAYDTNLSVKNNNKVLMPDLSIISKFVDHVEQTTYDEYSDGESY
jgi:hypothetical protein